ncbi:MAG: septation ring formation regulator EzrA [Acidobacteria bacterium]|nr:MAG: septation ring formation regulator EzrA [Acidobacteriota bacterium]
MNNPPANSRQRYRAALAALVLTAGALMVHEIFGQNGYLALRKQKQEYQALEQQIERLKRENQELEKQVQALRSNPQAIEKVARDDMRLARPGEIIYTLPDKDSKTKPVSATPPPAK